MEAALPYEAAEGGRQVDTEQGCSSCGGDCPCPQACERREDARQLEQRAATGTWSRLFRWTRA